MVWLLEDDCLFVGCVQLGRNTFAARANFLHTVRQAALNRIVIVETTA